MENLKQIMSRSAKVSSAYDPRVDPQYLFDVLHEMGEIIFSFDVKNKKVFVNKAAQNTFDVQPSVFGLNSPEWLKHVHPSDINILRASNRKVLSGEEIKDEFRILSPHGSYHWVSRHIKPIFSSLKKLERLHVIMINIDAYKKLTACMENKIDELSQVVYRIAHDLRGPLMSMLGIVNLSKYELSDATSIKYMELISDSAKKMDNVLLSLSSVVSIMSENEKYKPILFKDVVRDILKSVEHLNQRKDLDIIVQCKQSKAFLSDPGLIHSILYNLIINAIKFRRRAADAFVKINITVTKGIAEIEIEDNGNGINHTSLEHIFKMFYKDNDQPGSSGLGLYIVKNCIDKLLGEISVKSEPEHGTLFMIMLPEAKLTK
jgi:signal transduction histidine kinase